MCMISPAHLPKYKPLSVAKTILAILWQIKEGTIQLISSHQYFRLLCYGKKEGTRRSSIWRLKNGRIIQTKGKDINNQDIFGLTSQGEKKALFAFINAEARLHKKDNDEWDGGWRIVFFDIPEKKRKYRDYLRKTLKTIGFREFQKSIWICPYPVPSFLQELLFDDNLKPHIRFITTSILENDSDLKKVFKLS